MGNALRSRDDMISLCQTHGAFTRNLAVAIAVSTAANSTSGKVSAKRYPRTITVPTFGGGVTGCYFTEIQILTTSTVVTTLAAHETTLGTLTVSGNSFSAGSAMPTKTVEGSSVTTASIIPMVVCTAAVTATTAVLTITYTDQDGNTGQTCTLTMPNNPVANTAFLMSPHLASGDTGVRAVTNMSISTGSAGTITCYGLLPQALGINSASGSGLTLPFLIAPFPMISFAAGERLAFYNYGTTLAQELYVSVCGIPDD